MDGCYHWYSSSTEITLVIDSDLIVHASSMERVSWMANPRARKSYETKSFPLREVGCGGVSQMSTNPETVANPSWSAALANSPLRLNSIALCMGVLSGEPGCPTTSTYSAQSVAQFCTIMTVGVPATRGSVPVRDPATPARELARHVLTASRGL